MPNAVKTGMRDPALDPDYCNALSDIRCDYCGDAILEPESVYAQEWQPYCREQCAIDAENDSPEDNDNGY